MPDQQRIAEITRIMNMVERTRAKLQSENQCYTCALGSHDECGDYCEKAADDYECEDEGCSNFKDGTPSYAKIDEDDLGTLFDYIPFLLSLLAAKDAEIERLTEAQRWIPVTERLPEEGQRVLVWNCASSPSHVATFTNGGRPENMWHYDDGYDDPDCWVDGVTHWMPLPAAPDHIPDATKMIGGAS